MTENYLIKGKKGPCLTPHPQAIDRSSGWTGLKEEEEEEECVLRSSCEAPGPLPPSLSLLTFPSAAARPWPGQRDGWLEAVVVQEVRGQEISRRANPPSVSHNYTQLQE